MTEIEMSDQQFIDYVVKSIVDHPDEVRTERSIDEMGTLISLHVSAEDMGTIIGKEGRTAKALRTLLRVLGAKHNARVNLKIIEPPDGRGMYNTSAPAFNPEEEPLVMSNHNLSAALHDIPQDELA